jgi:hypothetical protein
MNFIRRERTSSSSAASDGRPLDANSFGARKEDATAQAHGRGELVDLLLSRRSRSFLLGMCRELIRELAGL